MIVLLAAAFLVAAPAEDRDRDGVDDGLESSLIERFRPSFHVSAGDCDRLPARFEAGSTTPRPLQRDGTLYARVFPARVAAPGSLEIHYYHLWERDCGPLSSHDLDVEHVSALVVLDATGEWRARHWYAAAHEDTVCDTSNAARAEVIGASETGPVVWISNGKHASYLSRELCGQRGCGVDRCPDMVPLPESPIVNLGEKNAPLAGAAWIDSPVWGLREKLEHDFDAELLARLESSGDPDTVLARANGQWRATHFSLSIGGDALGALGHGGGSVVEAEQQTESALGKTFRAVGRALARVVGLGAAAEADAR